MNNSLIEFVNSARRWTDDYSRAFNTVSGQTYETLRQLSDTVKEGYSLLKQDFAAFKNTSLGSVLSGVGSSLAGAAAAAGGFLLDVTKKGLTTAITGAIQKEQDVLGLSNVLGKGQDANAAYKNIRTDAENSPFELPEMLAANKALLSVGGDAQKAREEVMNLANAVTATGGGKDKLIELSNQMKEIKSSGKASSDQLKQLASSGIDVYGMLSASTGKSADQFKGGVDYGTLSKSLETAKGQGGMYEDATGKQNDTVAGKWDMIKERGTGVLADLGTAFMPLISQVLSIGVKFSESFGPALTAMQPYIDSLASGLGVAVEYITGLGSGTNNWSGYIETIKKHFTNVWNTLSKVFGIVGEILGSAIEWIANSELLKDIFSGIYGFIGFILEAIGIVGEGIKWIWNNIIRPVLDHVESAYRRVKELVTGKKIKVEGTSEINVESDMLAKSKEIFDKQEKAKQQAEAEKRANDAKRQADIDKRNKENANLINKGRAGITQTEDTRKNNQAKSQEAGDTVSGGGQKTINITLGKFFDTIQFNTLNSGETSDQLENIVMECLGRVLYNGAKVI